MPKSEVDVLLLAAIAGGSSSSIMSSRRAPEPSTASGGEMLLKLAALDEPAKKPSSSLSPSSFAAEEKLNPPAPPSALLKLLLAPGPRGRPMGWKLEPELILRECEPIDDEPPTDGCPCPSCVWEAALAPPRRLLDEPETTCESMLRAARPDAACWKPGEVAAAPPPIEIGPAAHMVTWSALASLINVPPGKSLRSLDP